MTRPLTKHSRAELEELLEQKAEHVEHSYNSVLAELDRRAARKLTEASLILSVVGVAIAVGAFILSVLR